MVDTQHLSNEQREFVEIMGVFYERFGVARLVGRITALLMIAGRPLTLDDMAQALIVSRASVSINVRFAVGAGYAVRVGISGDRRDFYSFNDEVWLLRTKQFAEASRASLMMAERGLASLGPEDAHARERLEEMREYCQFSIEENDRMEQRWLERKRDYRAGVAAKRTAARTQTAHTSTARGERATHLTGIPSASDTNVVIERNH